MAADQAAEPPDILKVATEDILQNGVSNSNRVHLLYAALEGLKYESAELSKIESSQILELHLWPNFPPEDEFDGVSDENGWQFLGSDPHSDANVMSKFLSLKHWIFLIIRILNEKSRQRVAVWPSLQVSSASKVPQLRKFRLFFYLSWFVYLSPRNFLLTSEEKAVFLQFFIQVYQSLEEPVIRKVCMPFCGVPLWSHLGAKQLKKLLDARPEFKPVLRLIQKRYKVTITKHGGDVRFDSPNVGFADRVCLLDRDGLRLAFCQFIEVIENDFSKNIDSQNLKYDEFLAEIPFLPTPNRTFAKADYVQSPSIKERDRNASSDLNEQDFLYCERFLELVIDLLSQLPTRRIIRPVFLSEQVLTRLRLSKIFRHKEAALVRQLAEILTFYETFEVDDATGEPLENKDLEKRHYNKLKELQFIFFEHFQHIPTLKEAALGPVTECESETSLRRLLNPLNVTTLLQLADGIQLVDAFTFVKSALIPILKIEDFNTVENYKETSEYRTTQKLLVEILVYHLHKKPNQLTIVNSLSLYPTESQIWDPHTVSTDFYQGELSLALPKLNLQFLTVRDYLLRNFHLFRLESTYEIREALEDTIWRMKPRLGLPSTSDHTTQPNLLETQFTHQTRMGCPIDHFSVVLVKPPSLGLDIPSEVRAEIVIDLKNVPKEFRSEWDTLRQFDVLFLLAIKAPATPFEGRLRDLDAVEDFPEKFGVLGVRGCEIVEVIDEEGESISELTASGESSKEPFGQIRTYRVKLDPHQYQQDLNEIAQTETLDIYSSLNLLIRRKSAENNFKAILATIQLLMNDSEHTIIPHWLHDLFLGYGEPSSAQYFNLTTEIHSLDFADTFLDYNHIRESFPAVQELQLFNEKTPFESLCRIHFQPKQQYEFGKEHPGNDLAVVEPYSVVSRGPYPHCFPKRNTIRFTSRQVEAIRSGLNPGLTMIVGPPGTGKTDTAVQITHLLHKNFPDQRILIVAHSNQALNDLFEKIAKLDIDERYLLRLGMGEKELRVANEQNLLDLEKKDFSKKGRVNYMLERRLDFLKRVDELSQSLGIVGDFGASCETAMQFYRYQIVSRIQRFKTQLDKVGREGLGLRKELRQMREFDGSVKKSLLPTVDDQEMIDVENENKKLQYFDQIDDIACIAFKEGQISVVQVLFPFTSFFSDVPNGLFPDSSSYEADVQIAESCFQYLADIFKEIEECRAFELLRTLHDRGNYLLTRHAKVVAMTCTHAALVRQQMIDMRFKYDSLIMEESAQILEVETFIPMVLQMSESEGVSRLKRVVLMGDHHQLPPVVKNRGFQQYGRLDQSMFSRFIRLQVPYVQLDKQGRCRKSLRELFSWRYCHPSLHDLPIIENDVQYSIANPGFTYDYQFVDIKNFEGKGETCPSPYFYQNLGEAEFSVAIFMYMRLLGYPASKISILTTYNGQKALIKELIQKRCGWNPLIGWPSIISTVDKYQGQQNDYIILSLVRTKAVGHLRDIRRLVVAVSRAKLGLYVLGRFFKERPTKLAINLNEKTFSSIQRKLDENCPTHFVDDIYEMWEILQQKTSEIIQNQISSSSNSK